MEIKTLDDAIYDAIEETHCSLQQLTDDELIDCRKVLEKRLETIVDVATQHRIDADSVVDGFDYLNKDIEDFLNELKQNMENHNG